MLDLWLVEIFAVGYHVGLISMSISSIMNEEFIPEVNVSIESLWMEIPIVSSYDLEVKNINNENLMKISLFIMKKLIMNPS